MGLKVTACETSTFGKDEPAAERSGGVAPEPCGKNGMGILQINACYEKCMAGSKLLINFLLLRLMLGNGFTDNGER